MVALIVLSELGINIAPLLAGAGVVGLAIGFGAQTLVKDVITGIFILAEDTVAVGDVVDLGGHIGVVEAMTLRSIRLRDHTGAVHTIPFSAVSTVMNMTRDFGYAVFDIGIAYSEDLDRVIDLLRKLGDEMRQDKAFARDIREPIEVMGINRFADTAVIIRVRLKTAPGKQWGVEREFNRRLKRLFEEHGIARANAAAVPTIYLSDARPTPLPPSVDRPRAGAADLIGDRHVCKSGRRSGNAPGPPLRRGQLDRPVDALLQGSAPLREGGDPDRAGAAGDDAALSRHLRARLGDPRSTRSATCRFRPSWRPA